ncbi:uncharacterized protein LOC132751609 [Ruditapes philippinarum]|uniref:uncharacterized protein LOC132751609 n=1 Tax=Ruditapes philippinarum TaxID=129788 RepID=UPI00295BBFBC|nr:uncharacterized protein LOC132751609 [Ruditapes philippinarum]
MAEGTVNSDDMLQDSDEIEEVGCEQCEKYTGKYAVASGLCLQCTEYMCSICIEYHARYMPGHKIQNKYNMPKDICNVKCSDHSDQVIKFYCPVCDKFACMTCKGTQHQSCTQIAHLPAIVKDIENSRELKALEEEMEEISKDTCETELLLDSNRNFVKNLEDSAKSVINEHKEELVKSYNKQQEGNIEEFDKKMNEIIENLKKERQAKVEAAVKKENQFKQTIHKVACNVLGIVERVTDDEVNKIKNFSKQTKNISTQVQSVKSDIELKKKTQQRCKLFMAMKSAQRQANELKQNMFALRTNTKIQVQPFKVETTEIGMTTKQLDTRKSFFSLKHIHVSNRKKVATYMYKTNLRSFEVSSMCLLSNTQLLVADEKKESVLNFSDLNHGKDDFKVINISSRPAMVAKCEETEAVVTLPNLGTVTFMYFSSSNKSLIKTEDIKVGRNCYGIACCQMKLIVSFLNPPRIEVMYKTGETIMTFDTDAANMPMFSAPRYLAASPEHTKVYIVDTNKNDITSMTFDGKIESVYQDQQQDVSQIAVDLSGSVYACGKRSNNVNQLSNDLNLVKTLLDCSDGIRNPGSICCNESMLLIGSNTSNKSSIKVFKVSYE